MALIGDTLTEMACNEMRATLERIGGDPVVIQRAVDYFRAQHEWDHCRVCGTGLVDREDGTKFPCVSCSTPKRPYPKSRQGYRPSR